jgi:exopolyphosphatase/guanosine-5'-triphosphate,3'-diphosphate pyrophosphatase
MYAAVDLGSNSFRLHVGKHDGEAIRVVKSLREPIRLAAGLDKAGSLTDAAMQSALACLRHFRATLAGYRLDAVRVVATSTLRVAKNAGVFLPAAEQAIGHPVEIISGEEEGRLIYMGVANSLANPGERRLVIDIGGGSTELVLGRGLDIERVESFSVGTVKQSLSFFPDGRISASGFDAAVLSARSHFEDAADAFRPRHWQAAYGSSGTVRTIADVIVRNGLGEGVTAAGLAALRKRFIDIGQLSRVDLPGLRADRASTLIGGLAILIALFDELGVASVTPVEAGLRMGVLWDLHLRSQHRDRRDESVLMLAKRFHADAERAERVAQLAATLFTQLKPTADTLARLLYWSALLHEIGLALSQTGYHKHSAYMIESADLPGFTTREQKTMGRLVLAQKGNLGKVAESLADANFACAVLALRVAIVLMHARVEDADRLRLLRTRNRIEFGMTADWLERHPTLSYWIDKEAESWDEVGVDMTLKTTS